MAVPKGTIRLKPRCSTDAFAKLLKNTRENSGMKQGYVAENVARYHTRITGRVSYKERVLN